MEDNRHLEPASAQVTPGDSHRSGFHESPARFMHGVFVWLEL